jgi:hypothetical protein
MLCWPPHTAPEGATRGRPSEAVGSPPDRPAKRDLSKSLHPERCRDECPWGASPRPRHLGSTDRQRAYSEGVPQTEHADEGARASLWNPFRNRFHFNAPYPGWRSAEKRHPGPKMCIPGGENSLDSFRSVPKRGRHSGQPAPTLGESIPVAGHPNLVSTHFPEARRGVSPGRGTRENSLRKRCRRVESGSLTARPGSWFERFQGKWRKSEFERLPRIERRFSFADPRTFRHTLHASPGAAGIRLQSPRTFLTTRQM